MLFKLLILAFVVLLIFGAGRIAQVGKGLGEGIRNFKKGVEGDDDDAESGAKSSNSKGGKLKE
jgi:sec-independent protein translocase protein TatA